MPVIKGNDLKDHGAVFTFHDVEERALQQLADAQEQADALLRAARVQAEDLRRRGAAAGLTEGRAKGIAEGLEEGRQQGYAAAMAEQSKRFGTAAQALEAMAIDLSKQRFALLDLGTTEVIALAIQIARKVTRRVVTSDPTVATASAGEALRMIVGACDVTLRVNSADLTAIEESVPALRSNFAQLTGINIIVDDAIAQGGAVVATKGGLIDATLETQLDRIAAELLPDAAPVEGAL